MSWHDDFHDNEYRERTQRRWQPPKRARIESATTLAGIYLYTPFDEDFVSELKAMVPASMRLWEADDKRWYVFGTYADQVVRKVFDYWPDAQDNRREEHKDAQQGHGRQRERAQSHGQWQQTTVPNASPDHAALYVTQDAPPEVIRAAYKALMLLYHPDRDSSADATTKAQRINGAFSALKKAGKA